jgi:1-acyl-sn-glycerol-3-phosphate acyltransferase
LTALPGTVPALGRSRRRAFGSALRLGLVPAWTVASALGWFAAGLGRGGVERRRRVVRGWARVLARILQIRIIASGPVPRPPFLLVANHLSYLDVIVLASLVDTIFVAKREVRGWPLFGPLARAIGCIFVDRENPRDALRVATAIQDAVRAGHGVVLFAEGTSSDGSTVLELRPALLEWPARAGHEVHTAALSYHTAATDPEAGQALCWWGDMSFLPHLAGVCRLGPSGARVVFGDRTVAAADRRNLARSLRTALLADFTPSGPARCAH